VAHDFLIHGSISIVVLSGLLDLLGDLVVDRGWLHRCLGLLHRDLVGCCAVLLLLLNLLDSLQLLLELSSLFIDIVIHLLLVG